MRPHHKAPRSTAQNTGSDDAVVASTNTKKTARSAANTTALVHTISLFSSFISVVVQDCRVFHLAHVVSHLLWLHIASGRVSVKDLVRFGPALWILQFLLSQSASEWVCESVCGVFFLLVWMARTSASAGTKGRKQKNPHAATGLVKNKATSPAVRLTDMKASAGQSMSIAGAKISERLMHFRADLALGFYKIRHPVHPVRRVAAVEATKELKAAATGNNLPPEVLFQSFQRLSADDERVVTCFYVSCNTFRHRGWMFERATEVAS